MGNAPHSPLRELVALRVPLVTPEVASEKLIRVESSQSGGGLCTDFGKPQLLTMTYTGGGTADHNHSQDPRKVKVIGQDPLSLVEAHILVTDKDKCDDSKAKIFFEGDVDLGGTFVIDSTVGGRDELRSNTAVHIFDRSGNWLQTVKFHTSCSQPLFLEDQFGSMQLVGFVDKTGDGASIP